MSNLKKYVKQILLIDSDDAFGRVLQQVLDADYELRCVPSVERANLEHDSSDIDVVLLNLDGGDQRHVASAALEFLRKESQRTSRPPIIAYSWQTRGDVAIEAFQCGVADFLEQPLDIRELKFALDGACRRATMARQLAEAQKFLSAPHVPGLLGNTKAMDQVNDVIRKVAGVFTSVLITGESGTGKGLVAQAMHRLSQRADKPFVAFSACAFPESLIEDELFGHERGAFTGASQLRRGRFEEANGGTIFLDEIGDLALPLQAKLLRVLQERSLERLGSNVSRPVDVRVICATSRNLQKMMQEGTFREDLYFRISVVTIPMPPLRKRVQDIPLLAEYFLRMFAQAHNKRARTLTPGFLSALARHSWPGNVRELQNVIERSVVLANGNEQLGIGDLPEELRGLAACNDVPAGNFHQAVQAFKCELVRSALRAHGGNKLMAARELGISRCYLHRLLNHFKMKGDHMPDEVYSEVPESDFATEEGKELGVGAI